MEIKPIKFVGYIKYSGWQHNFISLVTNFQLFVVVPVVCRQAYFKFHSQATPGNILVAKK